MLEFPQEFIDILEGRKPRLNKYRCQSCEQEFLSDNSEEEARNEGSIIWGLDKKDLAIVCDDCYQEIVSGPMWYDTA